MREIKFRAWDKDRKIMYWWKIPEIPDGHLTTHEFLKGNVEIMLDTGVRDSNNMPIYEGDIIKFQTDEDGDIEKDVVNFIDGAFAIEGEFGDYSMTAIGWAKVEIENCNCKIEVIGNIYENPDLLTHPTLTERS